MNADQPPAVEQQQAQGAGVPEQTAALSNEADQQRAPKRQKIDAWHSYDPQELCDLEIKCADNRTIGVHRPIILRHSGLMTRLLEDLANEQSITVTESASDLKAHFLDILYDPSSIILPSQALHVLSLADKYDSPAVLRSCRRLLTTADFQLTCSLLDVGLAPPLGVPSCNVVHALALASKHGFTELMDRCLAYVARQGEQSPAEMAALISAGRDQLAALTSAELVQLLGKLASGAAALAARSQAQVQEAAGKQATAETQAGDAQRTLAKVQKSYKKLLAKHNRTLARIQAQGAV